MTSSLYQRRDLIAPAIPNFRKSVQEWHRWPRALLDEVQINTICFHRLVRQLRHPCRCLPGFSFTTLQLDQCERRHAATLHPSLCANVASNHLCANASAYINFQRLGSRPCEFLESLGHPSRLSV
uniref:Uncharacterized protein n=1 Tax=Physcomitrium patens TaxID=3218 RepID=A0A7I3YZK1_PHYPA